MADTLDLSIDQGATFSRRLTWKDSNNTAINLTGYTARMALKKDKFQSAADLSLTTENSGITLGGIAGTIDLLITAAQTADLDASYFYDLELVNGSTVVRLVQGTITVDPEVTT